MLNYLKEQRAKYESEINKERELIKDCEYTISECEKRIEEKETKLAVIDELIANYPTAEREESHDAEAEAESPSEEEQPADTPVVIQYSKSV